MGCYIWYSEEGPGQARAAASPSPLLSVRDVTAYPPTVWQYNCPCTIKPLQERWPQRLRSVGHTTANESRYPLFPDWPTTVHRRTTDESWPGVLLLQGNCSPGQATLAPWCLPVNQVTTSLLRLLDGRTDGMQPRVIGRQASLSLYTENSQGGNYVDGSTRRRRAYTIAASPFHEASNQIRRRGFSLTNRYTADNNLFRQLRSRCKTIRCGFIRLHHYNKQHFLIGYMVLTACIGLFISRWYKYIH